MKNFLLIKQIDKANHFIVGYLIYFLSFILLGEFWAVLPVIVLTGLKELIDMKWSEESAKFDWNDFAYTLAGMIPAFLIKIL